MLSTKIDELVIQPIDLYGNHFPTSEPIGYQHHHVLEITTNGEIATHMIKTETKWFISKTTVHYENQFLNTKPNCVTSQPIDTAKDNWLYQNQLVRTENNCRDLN